MILVVIYPNHIDMNGVMYPYDRYEEGFNPKLFYVPLIRNEEHKSFITFWYSEYNTGIFPVYTHIEFLKPFGSYNTKLDKCEYAVFPIKYISKLKLLLRQARSRLRDKYYNTIYKSSSLPDDICKYITTFLF